MRRRLTMIAVLLGVATILTACSPPDIGTIGIERNADSTLTVLIRVCKGSVDALIVKPVNSFPLEPGGLSSSDRWKSVADLEFALDASVVNADVAFPVEEDDLESDVLYKLMTPGTDGNAFSALFGASELESLAPGEVMANPIRGDDEFDHVRDHGRDGIFMLVSRDAFEQRAAAFCQ